MTIFIAQDVLDIEPEQVWRPLFGVVVDPDSPASLNSHLLATGVADLD